MTSPASTSTSCPSSPYPFCVWGLGARGGRGRSGYSRCDCHFLHLARLGPHQVAAGVSVSQPRSLLSAPASGRYLAWRPPRLSPSGNWNSSLETQERLQLQRVLSGTLDPALCRGAAPNPTPRALCLHPPGAGAERPPRHSRLYFDSTGYSAKR
jgi:hypothetical protein